VIIIIYMIFIEQGWVITLCVSIWYCLNIGNFHNVNKKPIIFYIGLILAIVLNVLFGIGLQLKITTILSNIIYDVFTPFGIYAYYELIVGERRHHNE